MRQFRITVLVTDAEAAEEDTIEELKHIYQHEVFPAGGYEIGFTIENMEELE